MWTEVGALAVAVGALLISLATYFTTRPRLRVQLSTAIELGHGVSRNAARVEVINTGRAAGHIQSVRLISTDRTFWRDAPRAGNLIDPTADVMGPDLPKVIVPTEAALWSFDYAAIRRDVDRQVRHHPVVLRAHVRVGHRTVKSSLRVPVGQHDGDRWQTRRVRVVKWFRSLRRGRVGVTITQSLADFDAGVLCLEVRNHGRGFSRRVVVHLVREAEDGTETLVPGAPVYRWAWLRPGAVKRVRPRLEVATKPEDDEAAKYWWFATAIGGGGQGNSAPTLATMAAAETQLRSVLADKE